MNFRIGFVCGKYLNNKETNRNIKSSNILGRFGFLTRVKAEYLASQEYDVQVCTYCESISKNINKEIEVNGV